MAYRGPVNRWDVFWTDLEPGVGHEQKGAARPVIVVSNDGYNRANVGMVTIVPATKAADKKRKIYPFEVELGKGTLTPDYASIVMPQQIRSISTLRLLEKIGTLVSPEKQQEIENRILEHLGIAFEAEGLA